MSARLYDSISVSEWTGRAGTAREAFIIARPRGRSTFKRQTDQLFDAYETALAGLKLDLDSGIGATIFLSDSANQEEMVRAHRGFERMTAAGIPITIVQQPPVGTRVAMQVHHAHRGGTDAVRRKLDVPGARERAMGLSIEHGPYRYVYLRNLLSTAHGDCAAQTEQLFGTPGEAAQSNGITLPQVVRTWLYVNSIDVNYAGASSGRNRVFDRFGINHETGFPASTGIEGRSSESQDSLLLDVHAIQGLQPGQNRAMQAPTHMNPTVEYGVTFERGREVVFGDRRHLFVSGTASIDNQGQIQHIGDVQRQTERAIENVEVMLRNSGAALESMRYLLVYLRDPLDADLVERGINASVLKDVPHVLLRAPVCRPKWLVEIEGIAIDGKGNTDFAPY